jgi:hypothetical protein
MVVRSTCARKRKTSGERLNECKVCVRAAARARARPAGLPTYLKREARRGAGPAGRQPSARRGLHGRCRVPGRGHHRFRRGRPRAGVAAQALQEALRVRADDRKAEREACALHRGLGGMGKGKGKCVW